MGSLYFIGFGNCILSEFNPLFTLAVNTFEICFKQCLELKNVCSGIYKTCRLHFVKI